MQKCLAALTLILLSMTTNSWSQERLVEEYLIKGELETARQVVTEHLTDRPSSSELRLQLGLVQVLQALEAYSQTMSSLGLHDSVIAGQVPFFRIPVPPNASPSLATNAAARACLADFSDRLAQAQRTLKQVPDGWQGRVPLKLGQVRLDFNGDGMVAKDEELWRVVDALNPALSISEQQAHAFGIHLDAADVRWLEGYCHLMQGLLDVGLAYDTQRLFDHTGHLFFQRVETPYPFLLPNRDHGGDEAFMLNLLDVIALVHLLELPLTDAPRMTSALDHFREVIALSRRSWSCLLKETDNHFEWIPNPSQTSVIPEWKVTEEMVTRWMDFLDEAQSILAGSTLVPFWRDVPPDQGINLARAFLQPRDFDLVLWLQGPAAAPYLEKGKVSSTDFWRLLNEAFNGQFLGFALWFN